MTSAPKYGYLLSAGFLFTMAILTGQRSWLLWASGLLALGWFRSTVCIHRSRGHGLTFHLKRYRP